MNPALSARRLVLDALEAHRGSLRLGPLSLDLGPGIYHLSGGNGSGKTTLFRAIAGIQPLASGSVRVNGRDPHRDPLARRDLAWVPVEPEHPPFLSVGETWRFHAALRERPDWDGAALARTLGIDEALPLGRCSTGQRRKAAILAGLAGDPSVWLLDEVFAPLDAEAVVALRELLERRRHDRVVVLSGHGAVAIVPDGVFRLEEGRLVTG